MKTRLLFLLLFTMPAYGIFSQVLYSSTAEIGNRYNPGLSKSGTPNVMFDDVSFADSLVSGSDSISITKVKVGIRRTVNAPATDVQIYYTTPNDTSTTINTVIKIPPVLLGTVSLPANGASLVTTVVSLGDSVSALFKIKTDTSTFYPGYQTFFIGASLSSDNIANGIRFTSPSAVNQDFVWIYNSDSSGSRFAGNFSGNPPATFYIQVFGKASVNSSILPVTLSKFIGEQKDGVNYLTWTTRTETNNTGFEVQRSADGITFNPIAFVNSKANNGNSAAALTYNYSDAKPFSGKTYYRLRQADKDGHSTLSTIVLLKDDKTRVITFTSVYPNPAKAVLNAVVTVPVSEKVNITVTDFTGRIVMNQSAELIAGDNSLSINISKLSAGNYVIKAAGANGQAAISHFAKQ